MSKRLTRIPGGKIKQHAGELKNTEVHVVTQRGHIIFGYLVFISELSISLKDKRDHFHEVALSDIHEIVYDSKDTFRAA